MSGRLPNFFDLSPDLCCADSVRLLRSCCICTACMLPPRLRRLPSTPWARLRLVASRVGVRHSFVDTPCCVLPHCVLRRTCCMLVSVVGETQVGYGREVVRSSAVGGGGADSAVVGFGLVLCSAQCVSACSCSTDLVPQPRITLRASREPTSLAEPTCEAAYNGFHLCAPVCHALAVLPDRSLLFLLFLSAYSSQEGGMSPPSRLQLLGVM